MDKIAAYTLLLENHPLWTKEAIFLSPAHAALVVGGPAVIGGAGEGNRLKGALLGAPAGYAGLAAGLAASLHPRLRDPYPAAITLLGGGGLGYLAGRSIRNPELAKEANEGSVLPEAIGTGAGFLGGVIGAGALAKAFIARNPTGLPARLGPAAVATLPIGLTVGGGYLGSRLAGRDMDREVMRDTALGAYPLSALLTADGILGTKGGRQWVDHKKKALVAATLLGGWHAARSASKEAPLR